MSTSSTAIAYATKTILSGKAELMARLPIDSDFDLTATLNYKYNMFPTLIPADPRIRYFGIGIGGRYIVTDDALTSAYKPYNKEMDLYRGIPFRVVPISEDLTAAERAQYRLRVRQTFHGIEYYCYYLKLVEFNEELKLISVDPNTQEENLYTLDNTNLNPVGIKPNTSGATIANAEDIRAIVKARIVITGEEVTEAINVIYGGDLRYAVISELALYSGEDRTLTGATAAGTTFEYSEAIGTTMEIKNTWNGEDMSQVAARCEKTVVFTSGTPLITIG